jgi:hypothetical protein
VKVRREMVDLPVCDAHSIQKGKKFYRKPLPPAAKG